MTDPNFSAIRARLRYESLDEFIERYASFVSAGGMFIPMTPSKLKPIGTTVRFQFLLADGSTALLGEGVVRQIQGSEDADGEPVGMLVKFSRLSRESKQTVERILALKDQRTGEDHPTLAPDSEELRKTAPMDAHAHGEPAPPPADETPTREGAEPSSQKDDGEGDDEQLDDLFLNEEPEPEPEPETGPVPTAPVAEAGASGSDVFSDPELDQSHSEGEGPREVGRTEAGLQIMAFDEGEADPMEDLADFAFEDEDEVDQMFDGIFGGGGEGGDEAGGFFGGDDGGFFGDQPQADGDALFDGGETHRDEAAPADDTVEERAAPDDQTREQEALQDPAHEEPPTDQFEIEPEIEPEPELDETVEGKGEGELEIEPEPELDETVEGKGEDELALEGQLSLAEEGAAEESAADQTAELDEVVEKSRPETPSAGAPFEEDSASETFDLEEEFAIEEEPPSSEAADEQESSVLEVDTSDIVDEVDELPQEREDAPPPQEGEAEPEAVAQTEQVEEPSDNTIDSKAEPSRDLMSALDSLDDDETPAELDLTIGSQAEKLDEVEEDEVEEDEEDEESLETLLAKAKEDIDKKRDDREDDKNDILDELIGDEDDLPPPPKNEPVFELNEKEEKKKKKKGGFIKKLFGKD